MSDIGKEKTSVSICWSIVGDKYISTIYRPSSAMVDPPPWYYETIIFNRNPETKQLEGIHQMPDGTSSERFARKRHWQITKNLLENEGTEVRL